MRWYALLVVWVVASTRGADAASSADVVFGPVNINSSEVRYMTVTSSSLGATQIANGVIINDPNHWFSFAVPGTCDGSQICAQAFNLSATATVIPFRCSPPPNASGVQVAQVEFTNTIVVPQLVCSASGGMLAITPSNSILDFGAIDLAPPTVSPTSTITITNVGTATVTLGPGNFTPLTGPFKTSSSLASTSIDPGHHIDITVTYTPVAERTADDPDHATIDFNVTGPTLTMVVLVTLRGHGVDRHAVLQSVAMEPDTFVKPGPRASLADIVIANTGGAPLGLYAPAITNGPVWSLANPEPADVPGFGMFVYKARFAPTDVIPSSATFTVMTTDPDVPMLTATISGTGKTRNVMMGPATIDMQYVAIGTTATVSEGTRGAPLQITNLDPSNTFEIHTLYALSNEFEVIGARGVELAPGATVSFDVSFTPDHVGSFDATAVLLLDDDPDPAATISLHGEGVAVDTRGGGGCSAGGNASGGAVLLIALLVLRRRRATILILVLPTAAAHADTRNLDLSIFDPTPSTSAAWFQMQGADVGREGDWAASALVSYANDPLVLRTTPNDNVAIQDRTMFELGGAFAFGDRFEVGLRFPLYLQSGENLNSTTMFGEPAAEGTAAGNLAVNAKARLWRKHSPTSELVIGTAVTLALPTETADQFAGSGKPQLDVLGLVSFTTLDNRLSLTAQIGGVFRATALFHDVDQGNGVRWGIGGSYRIQPPLAIEAEVFGELVPGGLHDAPTGDAAMGPARVLDAIEGLVGVRYQVERRFNVGLAVGRGATSAPGTPAFRGVLTVTFMPTADKSLGTAGHHTVGDADHDGIPDDVDKCPNEPEDKDGFQDEDGCPDPDNDGDGIPDEKDKCPNLAEDKDGFEDADGCPDVDNDHDGILDRFDRCPNQPETINGIDDDDGCPDEGVGLVAIVKDRVTLAETVVVTASGKVAPSSFNVLGQLGATLRAHTELIKIRVKGKLARAVVDWLIQYGIATERLEAQSGDNLEITVVDRY